MPKPSLLHAPILTRADRAALKMIVRDPHSNPAQVKRARVLLMAEGRRYPLSVADLASDSGVSRPTAYKVLRDPVSALRTVLDDTLYHRSKIRAPALSRGKKVVLTRIVNSPFSGAVLIKRARALLMASELPNPLRFHHLAKATGLSRPTLYAMLRDPEKSYDLLLRKSKGRLAPAARRKPIRVVIHSLPLDDRALSELARLVRNPRTHPLTRLRARAVIAALGKNLSANEARALAVHMGMDGNFFRRSLRLFQAQGLAGLMIPDAGRMAN